MIQAPKTRVVQTPNLKIWGAYLEQQVTKADSPLAMELQTVLGPLEFTTDNILDAAVTTYLEMPPYKERKSPIPNVTQPPIPTDVWYTERSSRRQGVKWVFIEVQPATDHIWYDTSMGQNSQ